MVIKMSKYIIPKLKLDFAVSEIQSRYNLTDDEITILLKKEIEKRE